MTVGVFVRVGDALYFGGLESPILPPPRALLSVGEGCLLMVVGTRVSGGLVGTTAEALGTSDPRVEERVVAALGRARFEKVPAALLERVA